MDLSDYQLSWVKQIHEFSLTRRLDIYGQAKSWTEKSPIDLRQLPFKGKKMAVETGEKTQVTAWNFKSNQLIFPWMQAVSETTPILGDLEISNEHNQ